MLARSSHEATAGGSSAFISAAIVKRADGVKVPQQPRNEMHALTVEQARILLKIALPTPYGPVLAVALTTGMRPREYLGLKWQDID